MEEMNHYYAVIMAGGGGTRLWPLSRQSRPKQMLRLGGDRTLFQIAVDRLQGLFPPSRVLVVTVAQQADELMREYPEIPKENFLIEPMPRGTASVVGLAAVVLQERDPLATMAVLTADHFIKNDPYFRDLFRSGFDLAQAGYLVTLGISPTFPATGYGYIQRGSEIGEFKGNKAFDVVRFKEKPDEALAKIFIEHGDHDWNSGMFAWRVDRILDDFKILTPALYEILQKIRAAWNTPERMTVVDSLWPQIKPQTIDYAIMERAAKVAVLPAVALGWNDVGSWDSLFDVFPGDEDGNINLGSEYIGIDSANSLICSENKKRLVVTIGVQNLVIVDTPDAVLICSREHAQKVREVVNLLKMSGKNQL